MGKDLDPNLLIFLGLGAAGLYWFFYLGGRDTLKSITKPPTITTAEDVQPSSDKVVVDTDGKQSWKDNQGNTYIINIDGSLIVNGQTTYPPNDPRRDYYLRLRPTRIVYVPVGVPVPVPGHTPPPRPVELKKGCCICRTTGYDNQVTCSSDGGKTWTTVSKYKYDIQKALNDCYKKCGIVPTPACPTHVTKNGAIYDITTLTQLPDVMTMQFPAPYIKQGNCIYKIHSDDKPWWEKLLGGDRDHNAMMTSMSTFANNI